MGVGDWETQRFDLSEGRRGEGGGGGGCARARVPVCVQIGMSEECSDVAQHVCTCVEDVL